MRHIIAQAIQQALEGARQAGLVEFQTLPSFTVERPPQKEFGDFSTNAALVLASDMHASPRRVAESLLPFLNLSDIADKVDVAGPGFINFHLKPDWLWDVGRRVLREGERYGYSDIGRGKKVLVEFVSADPNSPIHIGHGRCAAIGDVLANLLAALGYEVKREFYVNDAPTSTPILNLAHSVEAQYLRLLGRDVSLPENGYRGQYVVDIARSILSEHGDRLATLEQEARTLRFMQLAKDKILAQQRASLERFGVTFDSWFSEQDMHESGKVAEVVERLKASGHTYNVDGAVWLRTTTFGDDQDRPLVRPGGTFSYFASDIAYHVTKFERGFDKVINIWGPDYQTYVTRTKAALQSLGYDPERLEIFMYQIVRLFSVGEFVRVSKYEGELTTLDELLDEVGKDAARFFYLIYSPNAPLDFDLDLVKEQSQKNPVYYVQYAYARSSSLLNEAAGRGFRVTDQLNWSLLNSDVERELLARISELPEEIEAAVTRCEPHRLTHYAMELATAFHTFYTACRVLSDDAALSYARLALIQAAQTTLRNVLNLLGVSTPSFEA